MKKLTIENWKELQVYIDQADYNEYNSNAMTLLMWSNRYEVFFETFETFALVYTKMPQQEPVWLMPFCAKEYRSAAITKLAEISEQEHIPYEIHSMTKEFKNWLMDTYPMEYLIWDCYDARDYVYDRTQQETLSGKKMQKRRNHFHAFEKLYEGRYTYKIIEAQDIPNIFAFLKKWKAHKKEEEYETIDAEEVGIRLFFNHWETLPIQGGCIYIDGQLEAFNITSRLSQDTVQIHVEKANREIRGLYIAILKLFLETQDEEIRFVNREDDMGLPELRKAKRDMQPIKKIQKFGSCHQQLELKQADTSWNAQIRALWESSFEDETEASTAFYFEHFYHEEDTWILTSGQTLISMAQLRPMTISLKGKPQQVPFIVGVATNKEYEGCGYMKIVLSQALQHYQKNASFALLQAYNWDIYTSLGFQETYQCCRCKLNKQEYTEPQGTFTSDVNVPDLLRLYTAYTKDKEGYRVRDEAYYQNQFLPNAVFWQQEILLYSDQQIALGYVLLEEKEDAIEVLECIYEDLEALRHMLALLAQKEKKIYIRTACEQEVNGRKKLITTMMVKALGTEVFPSKQLFISESL